jgi:hypothetical protein
MAHSQALSVWAHISVGLFRWRRVEETFAYGVSFEQIETLQTDQ